jgi:hypothetical protein
MSSLADIFSMLRAHGMILERGSWGKPTSGLSNMVLAERMREPAVPTRSAKLRNG